MKQPGKMWWTIALVAGALTVGPFALAGESEEVGRIVLVVGEARITGKDLKVGDAVPAGAELSTGADGYLYLKTIDNGFLILRPGSVAVVETYQVDLANPKQSRFKFTLRQGVARSISGEAVSKARENFRFNTPVAAIGVRGTDFSIYTSTEETRVAVVSGGVIVSGFDAKCLPQGSGPCEGAGSLELFAGTLDVLQVQKGQALPLILEDNTLSPDIVVPPRRDEPHASSAVRKDGDKAVAVDPRQPAKDAQADPAPVDPDPARQKDDKQAAAPVDPAQPKGDKQTAGAADSDPQQQKKDAQAPIDLDPYQPDLPLEPLKQSQLQPIIWGRWQKISEDLPATVDISHLNPSDPGASAPGASDPESSDPDLSDVDNTIYGIITIPNSSYVLLWNKNDANTLHMPASGGVGFSLQDSQAHITGPQGQIEASVSNGRLDFNFGRSTFSTRIDLGAQGQVHNLNAAGNVTPDGIFYDNQSAQGNMIVRGALFQAQQTKDLQDMSASYVFQSDLGNGMEASGVTVWDKSRAIAP
ncbi:MAG: FecR domain-containing protein [Zoogloeaceae bacterium]|jgi:hypothetical protein|nr:FecR domain-containing protein [Zoogloeaceae bacterium]